jgi:hypothetical protein
VTVVANLRSKPYVLDHETAIQLHDILVYFFIDDVADSEANVFEGLCMHLKKILVFLLKLFDSSIKFNYR